MLTGKVSELLFCIICIIQISVPYTDAACVYTVCHCPFYGTLGINALIIYPKEAKLDNKTFYSVLFVIRRTTTMSTVLVVTSAFGSV